MTRPVISIVVPCHRAENTIAETVASVLAQSLTAWELILVSDDGRSYRDLLAGRGIADPRIAEHPVRSERAGHVAARLRGVAIAQGEIIADLDGDDVWRPTRLAELLPLAQRHGAAQDVLECFDDGGVLGHSGPVDGDLELLSPERVTAFDVPFHLVAQRAFVDGFWLQDVSGSADSLRAALIAARAGLAWLRRPLRRYRVRPGSLSQSPEGDRLVDAAYRRIVERLRDGDFALSRRERASLIRGFRRKQRLNRAHMAAQGRDPATPPFIAWVLSGAADAYRT